MPHNRYFSKSLTKDDDEFFLDGNESHHLLTVMRKSPNEIIEVIDGKGALFKCRLIEVKEKKAYLQVHSKTFVKPRLPRISLFQAIIKPSRLDIVIEKETELGVSNFIFYPAERSEFSSFSTSKINRIENLLIASIKQCGSLYLPKIDFFSKISKWKRSYKNAFFGDMNPQAPLLTEKTKLKPENYFFLVGPESGLTQNEENKLKALDFQGIRLHVNTLRSETAALLGIGLLSQIFLS